jgi:hypothetical protein
VASKTNRLERRLSALEESVDRLVKKRRRKSGIKGLGEQVNKLESRLKQVAKR